MWFVGRDRTWTAEELERLTPDERDRVIREGFVTDPAKIPADIIDRVRQKADARIAATEANPTST